MEKTITHTSSPKRRSLSQQLLGSLGLSLIAVGLTTLGLNYHLTRRNLEQQVQQRASSINQGLQFATEGLLELDNTSVLQRVVQNYATLPAVKEIAIVRPDGRVIAHSSGFTQTRPYKDVYPQLAARMEQTASTGVETSDRLLLQGKTVLVGLLPFSSALFSAGGKRGLAIVMLDAEQMQENVQQTFLTSTITLIAGIAVILGLTAFLIRRSVVNPIYRLQQAILHSRETEHFTTPPAMPANEIGFLAATFSDIFSQNLVLLEQARNQTLALAIAKDAADSANQAKSEFLANMSHELRTPLNGILGYAQILSRSKVLPEKERNGIDIIYQCGSHLLTLINDILDLSKIEARKLELAPKAIHVCSFLQSVVEICRIRAEQKGVDFITQFDPNLPESVEVDEKRLRQVLINLLGNAIKFTDCGSVSLTVAASDRSSPTDVRLKFLIADTGVGIAPEDRDRLFQAFEQVGDKTRQAEGTGLGLAICQQIVGLMGGRIQVESQLGIGSQFFFEVELPIGTDWVRQNSIHRGQTIVGYTGPRRYILVIDDRWENTTVLVNLLEPLGFIVRTALNGREGWEKMRQERPDLVITDIVMPVMNGFELLERVRQDPDLESLKVLVSSASVSEIDRQKSLNAGGDDFLNKPVDANELFDLIRTYIELDWVYESVAIDAPSEGESSSGILYPPSEEVAVLLELAREANLKALRERIQSLVASDERYSGFAAPILKLAKKFQAEEIEELLQNYRVEDKV
ncbi:ATP-binding protein [Oscillatoria sp. FACHB-1406]|uniref:ATP-binding protein n=1 Tax=Oscillatoria sp. FACHB-1406 TaxID=2692846 RepID=UPI001685053D|nr:ATP-binding protein [Oscillatoria sp. FACHB-1406]MBD2578030.1 response regulator [Oscillatoria sp. FACHB-1406]